MMTSNRFSALKLVALIAAATAVSMPLADSAYARGGGASFIYIPGQCNSAAVASTAVLIKSRNEWQFGVQMIGDGAGDAWTISWFKNGVLSYTSTSDFPSTWLNIGMSTVPSDHGTTVVFSAIATSRSGAVCTVQGSAKV